MQEAPAVLALGARGDVLAAATGSIAKAWKLNSNESWTLAAQGEILQLQVSLDGRYILAVVRAAGEARRDGLPYQLQRWRLAGDPKPDVVDLGHHLHPPGLLCLLTEDGSSILAGGQRWDIATGASAPALRGNEACVKIPGTKLHATIEGRHLNITDTNLGQLIVQLEHPAHMDIQVAALSPDGRHAATVAKDGSVQVWALDPDDLIAQACSRGPRALEARNLYMPNTKTDACGRARDSNTRAR
jgi:hypothetical protein